MLASFWPILTAIFIISALLKLVYKLIQQEKAPGQFETANRRLVAQQRQVQPNQEQVNNTGLPVQFSVVVEEHSLGEEEEEEDHDDTDESPADSDWLEQQEAEESHRLATAEFNRHFIASQSDHYGPVWPPQSSGEQQTTTGEQTCETRANFNINRSQQSALRQTRTRISSSSSLSATTTAASQINRLSRSSPISQRQQNAQLQRREQVQFINNQVNKSANNDETVLPDEISFKRIETSKQIATIILIGAHSLFLVEPCKYLFQLLDSSIKLFWSFLDSIEGIEPETSTTLLNRWWLSNHKNNSNSNNCYRRQEGRFEEGSGAVVSKRSNYFHRRYLSRRSLSAVLLDDLELEDNEKLSSSESDCDNELQLSVHRPSRLKPIIGSKPHQVDKSHRLCPISEIAKSR